MSSELPDWVPWPADLPTASREVGQHLTLYKNNPLLTPGKIAQKVVEGNGEGPDQERKK